jgi:hypothetical protein
MTVPSTPLEIPEKARISDEERTFHAGDEETESRQKHRIFLMDSRQAKVFVILLASMTVGAIILMALGNNPPSAGAFCLSHYYRLGPVEKSIASLAAQSLDHWNCIEIYYSGTKAGNIEQLVSLSGLADPEDIDCHFVVCNGLGGGDGQIQTTEKWQRQYSVRSLTQNGPQQTAFLVRDEIRNLNAIGICVIADYKTTRPTDFQIKSVEALVEALHRKFNIQPESIYYPGDWW